MDILISSSLVLHIISGFAALISGLLALLVKKGKKAHRVSGLVFFYSMLAVSFSALILAYFKNNSFLLAIGFFALYQNISGYRAIKNKSRKPSGFDWGVVFIGFVNGVFMLSTMNLVLLVFGGISMLLVMLDLNVYSKKVKQKEVPKNAWLRQHIGMMMGTYIATSTAFLVVNVTYVDAFWVPWLAPSIIMVPIMIYMQRKFAPQPKKKSVISSENRPG